MYFHPVFYFTLSYFFIGAVIIAFTPLNHSRKKPWLKFITYFCIVHGIIIAVLISKYLFMGIACILVALGAFEILRTWSIEQTGNDLKFLFLPIYILMSIGFIGFSSLFAESILYVYFLVITFDGFSQLIGQWIGKHKITPRISPNKTIEGFIGGFVCCVITSVLTRDWISISIVKSILLGSGIVIISFAGDISASWYKRKSGIKDFGTILPGHGGILDRFDSLIPAGCCFYIAVKFFGL